MNFQEWFWSPTPIDFAIIFAPLVLFVLLVTNFVREEAQRKKRERTEEESFERDLLELTEDRDWETTPGNS